MKILLTNFHTTHGGGHLTYVLTLAKGLAPAHEVTIAAPPGSTLLEQASALPGVATKAISFRASFPAMGHTLWRLRRILEWNRFDIVHVNGSADHRQILLAMVGMRRKPRIVLTKHNDFRCAVWETDGEDDSARRIRSP